tara:strand:- start:80 stop:340 length:261 start_codon:yes stop_codon:yes gene_type:complete
MSFCCFCTEAALALALLAIDEDNDEDEDDTAAMPMAAEWRNNAWKCEKTTAGGAGGVLLPEDEGAGGETRVERCATSAAKSETMPL